MKWYLYVLISILTILFVYLKIFTSCERSNSDCSPFNVSNFNFNSQLIGEGADDYEYFGFMYIVNKNISNIQYPFAFSNIYRYPIGFDFSFGYDGAFATLLGGVLAFVIPLPSSYNLMVIVIILTNLLVSIYYFGKIYNLYNPSIKNNLNTNTKIIIASLIFAGSAYVFARINSHLNLAFIAGWPVFTYGALLLLEKLKINQLKTSDLFHLYLGFLLISLGSLQYVIFLSYLFIPFLAYLIYKYSQSIFTYLKNNLLKFLSLNVIALTIFIFFFGGYIWEILTGNFLLKSGANNFDDGTLLDFITVNGYLGQWWLNINPSYSSIEHVNGLGIVGNILFVIALIYLLINQKTDKKYRTSAIILIAFFLLQILFITDFINLPFIPESPRFILILGLVFSIIFLLKIKLPNVILFVFLTLLIVERLLFGVYKTPHFDFKTAEIVQNIDSTAIFNVPMNKYLAKRDIQPYLFNKKINDGYMHYTADNYEANFYFRENLQSRFICNDLKKFRSDTNYKKADIQKLNNFFAVHDFGAITFNKTDTIGNINSEECSNVSDWWNWLNPEKFEIKNNTFEVQNHTFNTSQKSERYKKDIVFKQDGIFKIIGFYVTANDLDEADRFELWLPNGEEIKITDWEYKNYGLAYDFEYPFTYMANQNDVITINSLQKYDGNIYLTIYYEFTEQSIKDKSPVYEPLRIKLIHESIDTDVYQVY